MKNNRKFCWERALGILMAAAVLFSGADLTVLATQTDTQLPVQETVADEETAGEDAETGDILGGGKTIPPMRTSSRP